MESKVELKKQAIHAAKWSSITEIIAKLIAPITNMILARILVPEVFGVVATINMVISFADMFTDSGFQKYIVQHEFKSENDKINSINVAFWTNLMISIVLWITISIFSENIAILLGSPGLGRVIVFAGVQLPVTSFSSIQMAIYKRDFDYKTLFKIRIISVLIPFVVTIPLAYIGLGYWALIIGSTCGILVNSIILTVKSSWKPKLFYNINILKEMFSFSIWTLIETISIWISAWVDAFIIGSVLNSYYLGLYKTSVSTVNSIMTIIVGTITPILFATLSRLQNDIKEFNKVYLSIQKATAYLIIPMGAGMLIYSDFITRILLGEKWMSASKFIGVWAIVNAFKIILGDFCSEYYRAKGKPKVSLLVQVIFLIIYTLVCSITAKYNLSSLIYVCLVGRIIIIFIHSLIMKIKFNMNIIKSFFNILLPVIATFAMVGIAICVKNISTSFIWQFISIIICIFSYFIIIFILDKNGIKIICESMIKNR